MADSRAVAEDAAAKVSIAWQMLAPVADMETALDKATPVIHPELGDNLVFERVNESGNVAEAFKTAHKVVEATFHSGRHTGVTLEPRSILAEFNKGDGTLTVHHATQAPHMMQEVLAQHLRLPLSAVRVICRDIGGSYGIKVHVYPDEVAVAVIAKIMGRPVKFVADRLESFASDIHARDHRIKGRMAIDAQGRITAFDIDDLTGIGPYSVYPRTSAVEGNQVVNLIGGPYEFPNYRAKTTVVLQNKVPTCQYRAVGHPIATAVTEGLVDLGAEAMGMDPVAFRLKNLMQDGSYPRTSPGRHALRGPLAHQVLRRAGGDDGLPAASAPSRSGYALDGVHRGIGFASFIELTNPSPFMYGIGGARISAQDGCTVRIDPDGSVVAATGVTEQGQGTEAIIRQIVAEAVGVPIDVVRVITGDTLTTPYGGGTWACRGAGIGGEAALQAGLATKQAALKVAGAMLQAAPDGPRSRARQHRRQGDRRGAHVARRAGPHRLLPRRHAAARSAARADADPAFHHQAVPVRLHQRGAGEPPRGRSSTPAWSSSSSTGASRIAGASSTRCWSTSRCAAASCRASAARCSSTAPTRPEGQLTVGSMVDYLVPMAAEMPDIEVGHVETPTKESLLGAKGAGEAGTAGAPAAIMNAINDALRPHRRQSLRPTLHTRAHPGRPWPSAEALTDSFTRRTPMHELTPETITEAVLEQMATTSDPRLKEIMTAAVKHLHAFARDVNLTPAEWLKGIEFMTAVGKMCTAERQEFILLSDTLGLVGAGQRPARSHGGRGRHADEPARPVLPRECAQARGRSADRQQGHARHRGRLVGQGHQRARRAAGERPGVGLADRRRRPLRHPGRCQRHGLSRRLHHGCAGQLR